MSDIRLGLLKDKRNLCIHLKTVLLSRQRHCFDSRLVSAERHSKMEKNSRSPSKGRSSEKASRSRIELHLEGGDRAPPTCHVSSPNLCQRRASAVPSSCNRSPRGRSRSLRTKRGSSGMAAPSPPAHTTLGHSLSVPDDACLVRNFSITSKGVVNRGDSFRSRSSSVCPALPTPAAPAPRLRVCVVGWVGVGKSALRKQCMTSESICQYENCSGEGAPQYITVSVDGEETEVELQENTAIEDKDLPAESSPEAYVIVYSVTNRRSYLHARHLLSRLETSKPVILVANKTDLARLRTVSTVEGRSLAKTRGCKFVETSVTINHRVDELLVGVVTQARAMARAAAKQARRPSRATCIIKRLWRKTCMTSKSCDNLHAL